MCHHTGRSREELKELIAHELLAETPDLDDPELARVDDEPSFLNDERETDVDLLTDGGSEE